MDNTFSRLGLPQNGYIQEESHAAPDPPLEEQIQPYGIGYGYRFVLMIGTTARTALPTVSYKA